MTPKAGERLGWAIFGCVALGCLALAAAKVFVSIHFIKKFW